jgi:hypothetical protein
MFDFLRALGLEPMEWMSVLSTTASGSAFIGEAVDRALSVAQAIVILLTGDDIARLRTSFVNAHDPIVERRGTPQARPNVLFEAGLAFGRRPDRTILVELGSCRPFSDIAGRYIVRLADSAESRQILAERLRHVECAVDTSNRVDWLTAGRFGEALRVAVADDFETPNTRGVTLREACQDCGLVDIENRDDHRHPLPPVEFYGKAQHEVAISGVSAYRTFDQHVSVLKSLMDSGLSIQVLLLDPTVAADDLTRLATREKIDVRGDIDHVITTIRHERLWEHPSFKIRFLPRLPPFTAVMIDGDLRHDASRTKASPQDGNGQIRVQPVSWGSTHHTGIIMQFRKKEQQPLGVFDYFSADLRRQWRDAAEHPEFWS